MKCYPFEEKRLAKWEPPYIVQPKYDGDRGKGYPLPQGGYIFLTSEENPVLLLPHINEALLNSNLTDVILDGEFYNHHLFLEGGHELIHGIVSRTKNIHPRYKEMEFHLFDVEDEEPQTIRLRTVVGIGGMDIPYIKPAPYWLCSNLDEVKKAYDNIVNILGYEGIIIRHFCNPYEKKRSLYVMKFKPKKKDTYKIIGWNEEISKDGIPKGRIGSLTLSSQSDDVFSVSAGLNDEERNDLWDIRDTLSTMNAVVHYQHLTNKGVPKGCFDLEVVR